MANYGYIRLGRAITPADLEAAITAHAMPGWSVRWSNGRDAGHTWFVFIPGTRPRNYREARDRCLALGHPVGFAVALQDGGRTIAFRHGPNMFERWAQGCMEEALADEFGVGVYYDATDETMPVGHRWYRRGSTFYEYLASCCVGRLSAADRAWINRHALYAPSGFDAGCDVAKAR